MKSRGFTLAEVLLSLGALALVLVMAVGVLHFSLFSGRRGEHALRATMLAQEKLAQAARAPLAGLTPGRFPAPWDGYRYSFATSRWGFHARLCGRPAACPPTSAGHRPNHATPLAKVEILSTP